MVEARERKREGRKYEKGSQRGPKVMASDAQEHPFWWQQVLCGCPKDSIPVSAQDSYRAFQKQRIDSTWKKTTLLSMINAK